MVDVGVFIETLYSRAFIDFTCMPELSPRENTAGYEVDPVLRQ